MLRKLWWGTYPLGIAFWGFYIFGSVLVAIATGSLGFVSRSLHAHTVGFLFGFLVFWSYEVITFVGVWRSAGTSMKSPIWLDRTWAFLARFVVFSTVGTALWRLIMMGGAHRLIELATGPLDFD